MTDTLSHGVEVISVICLRFIHTDTSFPKSKAMSFFPDHNYLPVSVQTQMKGPILWDKTETFVHSAQAHRLGTETEIKEGADFDI